MDREPIDPHGWRQLAAELATTPDLVQRLLTAHTLDVGDRCRACTTGGTGQPGARWPCTVRELAAEARPPRHRPEGGGLVKCGGRKDCQHNAANAVHGGTLVLLMCTRCWREILAQLVDAAGIRVRPIGPGWAT